jgi:hypothetical protein
MSQFKSTSISGVAIVYSKHTERHVGIREGPRRQKTKATGSFWFSGSMNYRFVHNYNKTSK